MKTSMDNRVTVKLFAGYLINVELKREFFTSDKWRLAQIAWQSQNHGLQTVPFQDKEYVGKYLEDNKLTTEKIRDWEEKIKKQLLHHCPSISETDLKFYLFPQVFIS